VGFFPPCYMASQPLSIDDINHPLSTEWDCYKTDQIFGLGDLGGDILTEDDIENSVNLLQSKIFAVYEKTCPLKRARLNQSTPYWNSDLAELCKVARRAWNNSSSNPEDFCSSAEGMKLTARFQKMMLATKLVA
jgi:hypothetical protein